MMKMSSKNSLESTVLQPILKVGKGYTILALFLLSVVLLGVFAFLTQLSQGLAATAMRDKIFWGIYIVNFVFFIGISHAGTLISAILRVTNAGWRTPITRMAEMITVVAIMVGATQILFDQGRPDRIFNLFLYGRYQSPLVWDLLSISTYLVGSCMYLYLPLIPDLALCRDRLAGQASRFKLAIYRVLAVGWTGAPEQKKLLERAISVMAIIIIPIAISVHTVVSWVFSMTLRPGWNSTLFGPYFVIGAIFSGIASIIIVMAIFRKIFHLEQFLEEKHFLKLGTLLAVTNLAYIYFTLAEYLTMGYKLAGEDKELLTMLFAGSQAPAFWAFLVLGLFVPLFMVVNKKTRNIPGLVVASALVNVGMWIKRFVIVVPTLQVPLLPFDVGIYRPTWVEWSLTAGSFAGFALLFMLFARIFPIMSIWEVREELETEKEKETEKVIEVPAQPQPKWTEVFPAKREEAR